MGSPCAQRRMGLIRKYPSHQGQTRFYIRKMIFGPTEGHCDRSHILARM